MNETFECQRFISSREVEQFGHIVGDANPIHVDDSYIEKTCFKNRLVQGTYLSGIIGKILGVDFPGKGTILLSQNLKFIKPIYVDTQVRLVLSIRHIIQDKKRFVIQTNIHNEIGEIAVIGEAKVWYPR